MRMVKIVVLAALVAALISSGCAGSDNGGATEYENIMPTASQSEMLGSPPLPTLTRAPTIESVSPTSIVVASGVVQPSESVDLGFQTGGLVAEVAVAAGDRVEEGQVLAQLDPGGLDYAVTQAEEALKIAETRLDQAQAGARPEELAAAEARLAETKAKVSEAELNVEEARAATSEAEAGVEAAEAVVLKAETEAETEEAQANVAVAEAKLEAARSQTMAAHAKVDAARALRDEAQAQLNLLKAGAPVQDVTVLEAQVRQAEAALARVQVDLEKIKLTAPFSGTVIGVEALPGETVVVGQIAIVLANLDTLHVHTDDVDQLDVVKIKPGQQVRVSLDALPGRQLSGQVLSVPMRSVTRAEEIVYPIVIELIEKDPDLRWGMTVIVEITTTP